MATYEETLAKSTGNNYRQLGIISAALGFVTLIAIVAGWYSYIYYPEQVILDGPVTQPIRAEIPLEVMPALPDDLAVTYDEAKAEQLDRLVTFGAVDVEDGIVRIPFDEAVSIMVENDMFEVREGAPAPPEPAELDAAVEPETVTEEAPVETEAATEDAPVETEAATEDAAPVETEAATEDAPVETEAATEDAAPVETEAATEDAAVETEAATEDAAVETEAATEDSPVETEAATEDAAVPTVEPSLVPEATPVEPLTFE